MEELLFLGANHPDCPSIMKRAAVRLAIPLLAVLSLAAGCDRVLAPPPVVTIAGPSNTEAVVPPVEISGTVRGSSDIVQLTYNVNGGEDREVAITPGREVSFSFVLEELPRGAVVVTVNARDSRGNAGQSVHQFQTPMGPHVTILEPVDGQIIRHPGTWVRLRIRHPIDTQIPTYAVNGSWSDPLQFETRALTAPVDTVIGFTAYLGDSGPRTLTVRISDGEASTEVSVNVEVEIAQREYSVTNFGEGSRALGLNESGTVVGQVPVDGLARGFSWSEGVMTLLPTPDGAASSAAAINEAGVIAGMIDTGSCPVAAVWEDGVARVLTPEGTCHERAADINNTGYVLVNRGHTHGPPYLVNLATDDRTEFSTCGPSPGWDAVALNDQNRVVGFEHGLYPRACAAGFPAGFAWPWVDVTIFGRASFLSDINNRGTVVFNTGMHADRIVLTGEVDEAVYLTAYGHARGRAINEDGTVLTGHGSNVMLWTPDRSYHVRTGQWEADYFVAGMRNHLNNRNMIVAGGALLTPLP
jgi:uncharacterized membrane protein